MSKPGYPVRFENLSFSFNGKKVLDNISFDIEKGKTYSIIGERGSGKTTILKIINGLLKPDSGQVLIEGKPFEYNKATLWRRRMGYCTQNNALFPHMTILENMSLIAKKTGWEKINIERRALELCELINLPNDRSFLKKKPREINIDQQQRVSIARAIFKSPQILLMDDAFTALSSLSRTNLQSEFLILQEKLKMTIIFVTHDISEAFNISDELILIKEGQLVQKGRPNEFLMRPNDDFTKKFIESHSPNHLLKSIKLYTLANSDIYLSRQEEDLFTVTHYETKQTETFSHLDHLFEFHKNKNQDMIYWVDPDGILQHTYLRDPRGQKVEEILYSKSHLLAGMKYIYKSPFTAIPVVDINNKLIGEFSLEAIDAL